MIFKNIRIENFCSIASMAYPLSNQGLVVISGHNKDAEAAASNGSGKSTAVVDALCWALFGKTTKGGPADSVTPGGKGRGTAVTVEFEQSGRNYVVTRHRKHATNGSKTVIVCDGVDISKATSDDADKQLQDILGITLDTFLYTTILGQGMMFRFSQLTDQNRKEILEGIAGSSIYEAARVAAREAAKKHEQAAAVAVAASTQVRSQAASLDSQIARYAALDAEAERDYQTKLAAADYSIATSKAQLEAADAALAALPAPPDSSAYATFKQVENRSLTAMMDAAQNLTAARTRHSMAEREVAKIETVGLVCDLCGSMMTEAHREEETKRRRAAVAAAAEEVSKAAAVSESAQAMHKRIADQLQTMQIAERDYNLNRSNLVSKQSAARSAVANEERSKGAITRQGYQQIIDSTKAQLAEAGSKLARLDADEKAAATAKTHAEFWVSGFQEIRVASIDNLLSFLNSRVGHYMQVLTGDDIKVSLAHTDKGKIDLNVKTSGGSYLSASGGEKDRIDIALALALHDLACQCTNWHSNLLVLDEIAVFVDDAGIERIMKLVAEKLDRVDSVFLISHNPLFASYGDRNWTVVKEGGISRLESS